jgi:uncharacterized protein (TIGR02996 family)
LFQQAAADDTRTWQPADDLEAHLLGAIAEDAACDVYGDWLEARGDDDRAEFLRVHVILRASRATDPRTPWLTDRLAILSRIVDPTWRDCVVPVTRVHVEPAPAPNPTMMPPAAPPRTLFPSVESRTTWIQSKMPSWIPISSMLAACALLLGFVLYYLS